MAAIFIGEDSVNRPLHQVGHPQPPHSHVEPQEIGVHDLGGVIQTAGLAGI